jgi:ferrous iron transport protein A
LKNVLYITAKEAGMTLDQLLPGQNAIVQKISGGGAIRRRLMDMGLVNGTRVQMLRRAPLGDPIQYRVLGYYLALRKSEARLIEIELSHESGLG